MRRKTNRGSRWLLTGLFAIGSAGGIAVPAMAADENPIVAKAKVPPAVSATADQYTLDSHDIVFRRVPEGKERYIVNFVTPTNLRMQVRVDGTGQLLAGPELTEQQPENGPKGADRQRLAAEWLTRVRTAQAAATPASATPPVATAPPVAPVPAVVPGAPPTAGAPAAPAASPVATEIRSADLPAPVLQSLDRFTTGGKDISYYRLAVEDRQRYQAHYTHTDGSRREVTVADNGSLMAGPVVLSSTVDDRSLTADRPDNQQIATSVRIEPREVPARAMNALSQYVKNGSDVRYRRDTYTDNSVGYTAHWIQTDNGERFFVTAAEDGALRVAPRLSMYQPTDRNAPGQATGVAVRWEDLPDRVKQTLEPLTREDRKAKYYKQTQDGKISYGSTYAANGNDMWVRVDEAGKTIVSPVSARTGKPVERMASDDKSIRVTSSMKRDRVQFVELPKSVQQKVLKETDGARGDIVNMKHEEGGKTVYHTAWLNSKGETKELWLNEKGEAVAAPAK